MFPPGDNTWKDADSKMLLKTAWNKVLEQGWKLENLDCVVAIEQPKILPFRNVIRESIANILGCSIDQVFINAKTGRKLGEIGNG